MQHQQRPSSPSEPLRLKRALDSRERRTAAAARSSNGTSPLPSSASSSSSGNQVPPSTPPPSYSSATAAAATSATSALPPSQEITAQQPQKQTIAAKWAEQNEKYRQILEQQRLQESMDKKKDTNSASSSMFRALHDSRICRHHASGLCLLGVFCRFKHVPLLPEPEPRIRRQLACVYGLERDGEEGGADVDARDDATCADATSSNEVPPFTSAHDEIAAFASSARDTAHFNAKSSVFQSAAAGCAPDVERQVMAEAMGTNPSELAFVGHSCGSVFNKIRRHFLKGHTDAQVAEYEVLFHRQLAEQQEQLRCSQQQQQVPWRQEQDQPQPPQHHQQQSLPPQYDQNHQSSSSVDPSDVLLYNTADEEKSADYLLPQDDDDDISGQAIASRVRNAVRQQHQQQRGGRGGDNFRDRRGGRGGSFRRGW